MAHTPEPPGGFARHRVGLSFVLLVAVGLGWWFFTRPDPHGNALHVRQVATRGLAEHLARTHPGQQALVISNPFIKMPTVEAGVRATEEAGVQGVRDGLADKATLAAVAFPELRPDARDNPRALLGDIETSTPLSYLVASDAFDKVWQQNGSPPLVISLIGLPAELDKCAAWTSPGPPRFALLWPDLRVVGDAAAVQKALKAGKLAAFVLRRPGGPDDSVPLEKDRQAQFDRRFVLVTAENVEAIVQQYPGLF